MNKIIKINNEEFDVTNSYDYIDNCVKDGDLIKLKRGEFYWTKKYFVKTIWGLSKIVPFPDKFKIYSFALRLQFTDLYYQWMNSKGIYGI